MLPKPPVIVSDPEPIIKVSSGSGSGEYVLNTSGGGINYDGGGGGSSVSRRPAMWAGNGLQPSKQQNLTPRDITVQQHVYSIR